MAFQANAAWLEVTGKAPILESDSTARINALEDATYQAMLYSGADIASFNHIKPYFATEKEEYQFSGNSIRHVMVLKQKKKAAICTLRHVLMCIHRQIVATKINTRKEYC